MKIAHNVPRVALRYFLKYLNVGRYLKGCMNFILTILTYLHGVISIKLYGVNLRLHDVIHIRLHDATFKLRGLIFFSLYGVISIKLHDIISVRP